jgi:hypothetical protein
VSDLVSSGILKLDALVDTVLRNLRNYYDVPDDARPIVQNLMLTRQVESLLDPLLILEMRRSLTNALNSPIPNATASASPWRCGAISCRSWRWTEVDRIG